MSDSNMEDKKRTADYQRVHNCTQNLEVRYFNLKSLGERWRINKGCSPQHCHSIRQRHQQHVAGCGRAPRAVCAQTGDDTVWQRCTATSPVISRESATNFGSKLFRVINNSSGNIDGNVTNYYDLIANNRPEIKSVDDKAENIRNRKSSTSIIISQTSSNNQIIPPVTRAISVYTFEEKCSKSYCETSTAHKYPVKINIQKFKLNSKEIKYMQRILELIRAWIDKLPQNFNSSRDPECKETIIEDLASDILDEYKISQLSSDDDEDRQKYLKFILYRWVHRLQDLDIYQVLPQIEQFLIKLKEIPVPVLSCPQNGNCQVTDVRQDVKDVHIAQEQCVIVPKTAASLEGKISMWIDQQQSSIFKNSGKCFQYNKIIDLAQTLDNRIKNNSPPTEIVEDISKWLNDIMVTNENKVELVYNMAQDLLNSVGLLQHDRRPIPLNTKDLSVNSEPETIYYERRNTEEIEQDNLVKVYIDKFIQHNPHLENSVARRAANNLLQSHLKRLNLSSKNTDNANNEICYFSWQKLMQEWVYIEFILDWLKNIPVDPVSNTIDNRELIDLVLNLAATIHSIEEQRETDPDAIEYKNSYIVSLILSQFLDQLPISKQKANSTNVTFMADQLLSKIVNNRQNMLVKNEMTESMDSTGINNDNIGDFIEEYIRIFGVDIADNELKLEVWAILLIREIKRIICEASNSSIVSKGQCYNCLKDVPIPGDETARLFSNELEYIEIITNWMKNLPLKVTNFEKSKQELRICELAQKIAETDYKKANNRNDSNMEADFEEYVKQWIFEQSHIDEQNIIIPVAIQQLINRIKNIKKTESSLSLLSSQVTNKSKKKLPIKTKKSKMYIKASKSLNESKVMTDIIEKWSQSLPVEAENERTVNIIKDDICVKLFQKVGELNIDPKIMNNDVLYEDMIRDEIDTIFDIYQYHQLKSKKEHLKADIVGAIIDVKNVIKEKTVGDFYKLKLEDTIINLKPDNNETGQIYDPDFELYQRHLINMFIIENFDHSDNEVMNKYEKRLINEIDDYFKRLQNKTNMPFSEHKDKIHNELYSSLYKVPIPNEILMADQVEEFKTRCEIDEWFEQLPIQGCYRILKQLELDKVLGSLAKRIHEIEKKEAKSDEKLHQIIFKCLQKLPLTSYHENNLKMYANKLQSILKSTATQRKCVLNPKSLKRKKNPLKTKDKMKIGKQNPTLAINCVQNESVTFSDKKNIADIIFKLVQTWCIHTVCLDNDKAQTVIDDLFTKIMIKISELNIDPVIFNVDDLYDKLLDDELEIILSTLPTCPSLYNNKLCKSLKKEELKEGIKSVKPLIREEYARLNCLENLYKTVDNVLNKQGALTPAKEAFYHELKDNIVENFIQYRFGHCDFEEKQQHKRNIAENISKYVAHVEDKVKDKNKDNNLVRANQLICELSKMSNLSVNFEEVIQEIEIKSEVNNFFNHLKLKKTDDKSKVNQLKVSLAKKLNYMDVGRYNTNKEDNMKREVLKCIRNLNINVSHKVVEDFLNQLKVLHNLREISESKGANACNHNMNDCMSVINPEARQNTCKISLSNINCECPSKTLKTQKFNEATQPGVTSHVKCECKKRSKDNINEANQVACKILNTCHNSKSEICSSNAVENKSTRPSLEYERFCDEPIPKCSFEERKPCSENLQANNIPERRACCSMTTKWSCSSYDD